MVVPDSVPQSGIDPQDMAEVFDETHLDDEGQGDLLLDEMDEVFDATRDHDANPLSRLSPQERLQIDRHTQLEAQADALLGEDRSVADDDLDDETTTSPVSDNEIELVYGGLMRNQRGAQASTAHWEAKRLSNEDIKDLGYGPADQPPSQEEDT